MEPWAPGDSNRLLPPRRRHPRPHDMMLTIWIVTALLLALWSVAAWGLHGLLMLGAGWQGDPGALVDRLPHGELLDVWLPGWRAASELALRFAQSALGWLGDAAGLVSWLTWGAGALLLLAFAGLLTLVVRLVRRADGAPSPA